MPESSPISCPAAPGRGRPARTGRRRRRLLVRGSRLVIGVLGLAAAIGALPAAVLPLAAPGIALLLAGCSRHPPADHRLQAGADAEWDWLVAAKARLDGMRTRLASRGAPAAALAPPAALGTASAPPPPDPLARDTEALAAELGRRLVAYINADPPLEGAPLTARQLAAMRMKSDEEIAVAHEYVARSGDYARACEIYEAALAADPQNPRLRDELARARTARYMTGERFQRAVPGMSADQVRAALGTPNAHDVRRDPARGVVGWFYPRDGSGTAAAVWFEQQAG
jgi:hypothetical protein